MSVYAHRQQTWQQTLEAPSHDASSSPLGQRARAATRVASWLVSFRPPRPMPRPRPRRREHQRAQRNAPPPCPSLTAITIALRIAQRDEGTSTSQRVLCGPGAIKTTTKPPRQRERERERERESPNPHFCSARSFPFPAFFLW